MEDVDPDAVITAIDAALATARVATCSAESDQQVSATPAPLDVERLALALHNTGLNSIGQKPGFHGRYSDRCICHPDAAQIANEYAAITPKDFSTRIYKENRGE
jgi:hypothetical protein